MATRRCEQRCALRDVYPVGRRVTDSAAVPCSPERLDVSKLLCVLQKSAAASVEAVAAVTKSLDADMEAERQLAAMVCSIQNKDECIACGS